MREKPASAATIRDATVGDADALLGVYAPGVRDTAVSFEVDPPTVADFAERVATAVAQRAWLVAEIAGRVVGYAYGGAHRERAAYRHSVETSVYLDADHRGCGIGKQLYAALLPRLAARGYCNAYAGITLPNDASVRLHESVGFEPVGVFRRVGWKFDAWHDVGWWQLALRDHPPDEGIT